MIFVVILASLATVLSTSSLALTEPPSPEALWSAVQDGNVALVQELIKRGAGVSRAWKDELPLFAALRRKNINLVKLLVEKGADVNAVSDLGVSVLRTALILEAGQDIIQYLIKKGARVGDEDLQSAAKNKGNLRIVRLLIEKGAKPKPDILHDVADDFEMVDFLIKQGAPVHHKDNNGDTALHKAALVGYLEAVRALLKNSADPKTPDAQGLTPLQLAELQAKEYAAMDQEAKKRGGKIDPTLLRSFQEIIKLLREAKNG